MSVMIVSVLFFIFYLLRPPFSLSMAVEQLPTLRTVTLYPDNLHLIKIN